MLRKSRRRFIISAWSKLVPFTPDMSFEDMIRALSNMTLRALLSERGIENDRFDELNAALNRIPNI